MMSNRTMLTVVLNTTEVMTNAARVSRDGSRQCRVVTWFYINTVVAGTGCLIGIVGSLVSFVALGLDSEMNSVASLTLRSLACSDALLLASWVLSYSVPAALEFYGVDETVSAGWVYLRAYTYPAVFISQMIEVWLTVLIAVCRYVSVGLPLRAASIPMLTISRAAVVAIVIASVVFNLPRFLHMSPAEPTVDRNNVTHYYMMLTELGTRHSYRFVYSDVLYSVVTFILPFLLLAVFSVLLVHAYQAQRRRRAALVSSHNSAAGGGEHNITRVIVAVVVVFAVSNFPAKIFQMWGFRGTYKCPQAGYYVERLFYVLELLNSTANFIIYCALRPQFRAAVRRGLRRQELCRKDDAGRKIDGGTHRLAVQEAEMTELSRMKRCSYQDLP